MGSVLKMAPYPDCHNYGDITGNTCYCLLFQLLHTLLLTGASLTRALHRARTIHFCFVLGKEESSLGEDPALQPAEADGSPSYVLTPPKCVFLTCKTQTSSLIAFFLPPPTPPAPPKQSESPNPSSFLPKTRAPAEQLVPTSRAEPSTTNGLKSPHCTETSLQKQPYFTQTLLNCPALLLRFLSHQ